MVTDSTLENVLNSKDIVDLIRRKEIVAEVVAIANKQELLGALSPALVQRILGVKTYGMVSIDTENRETLLTSRNSLLRIITEALKIGIPKEAARPPKPELTF